MFLQLNMILFRSDFLINMSSLPIITVKPLMDWYNDMTKLYGYDNDRAETIKVEEDEARG